jgi:hypothetical protein
MATQEEQNKNKAGEADGDKKQEWAEMSDDQQSEEEEKVVEKVVEKPKPPPARKGKKNSNGDYIVQTFEIEDLRDGLRASKKANQSSDDESSSDDGYGDEDDN